MDAERTTVLQAQLNQVSDDACKRLCKDSSREAVPLPQSQAGLAVETIKSR